MFTPMQPPQLVHVNEQPCDLAGKRQQERPETHFYLQHLAKLAYRAIADPQPVALLGRQVFRPATDQDG